MATFNDPNKCFAQIEVIERLLEIREELGFAQTLYLPNSDRLADFLDAYGFDVYTFAEGTEEIKYGDYRSVVVPGGDTHHMSLMGH